MKNIDNNMGFTLVEILISITIIGIVLFAFSYMFLNGSLSIFVSKNLNEALLTAQREVETAIITPRLLADSLNFDFNGSEVTVPGDFLTGDADYNANNRQVRTVTITYFKPGAAP